VSAIYLVIATAAFVQALASYRSDANNGLLDFWLQLVAMPWSILLAFYFGAVRFLGLNLGNTLWVVGLYAASLFNTGVVYVLTARSVSRRQRSS
jgi:hypothetical protein